MPSKLLRFFSILCLLLLFMAPLSGCKRLRKLFKRHPKPSIEQKETVSPERAPTETQPAAAPVPPPVPLKPLETRPLSGGETQPSPEAVPGGVLPSPTSAPATQPAGPLRPGPPSQAGGITVSAGAEKKVAEGSYFMMEDAQALAPPGKNLQYQWSLVQGPPDRVLIVQGNVLQGVFKILDLKETTPFVFRLTASALSQDGIVTVSSDVAVTGFAAKIELKNHLGGVTRQVERVGEKTFVSRGRTLEIYDPAFALIDKIDFENPILELAGFSFQGKDELYALTEAGEWMLLDVTDPKAVGRSLVQKTGASFHRLKVTTMGKEAWATAIDKDTGLVWSLADLLHPKSELTLQGTYKNLRRIALWGKALYVVDRDSLYSLEATTGLVSASIPAGGAVTGLEVVEAGGKASLVLSLGEGDGEAKKGDVGLRVFDIADGKLTNERRFRLKGNPAVERMQPVASTSKLLLGVRTNGTLSLRLFDLETEKEIPLDFPSELKLALLSDMSAAPLGDLLVAGLADASALKVIKLTPVGTPPVSYKGEIAKTSASTLSAGAVKMAPGGASVFLLDFGSRENPMVPALLEIGAQDLAARGSLILGDHSYLSDFALIEGFWFHFALNLNDQSSSSTPETQPETQKTETRGAETQRSTGLRTETKTAEAQGAAPGSAREAPDGALRAFALDPKGGRSLVASTRIFGEKKGPNESRALGIDARVDTVGVTVAVAVGRTAGVGSRSGLALLSLPKELPKETDWDALIKGDLNSKIQWLPLQDVRDVKLSRDGKWALAAAGMEGLALVDLEKKQVALKTNPAPGAVADRVLLSNDQKRIFVSFISSGTVNPADPTKTLGPSVFIQVYNFDQGKLGLWGQMKGLSLVELPYGVRAPGLALSSDDLYLYAANGKEGLWVYNVSDPSQPVLIARLSTHGQAAGVAVGERYKNIYIADLVNGLEMAEFGF